MVLKKIREIFLGSSGNSGEDYLEIDLGKEEPQNKVKVQVFVLNTYEDTNSILNALREGYTIAIIDFKVLKQKDPIELKRAISKIKKTVDALEGSIAGHENLIIITPSFAKIYKQEPVVKKEPEKEFY